MKSLLPLTALVLFLLSCTFSKVGFPYKVKASVEQNKEVIYVSIDSSELYGMNNSKQLERTITKPGFLESNVWVVDSIQAFWIETYSDTFTKDFEFYYKNKHIEIDSFSFFCTFMDSVRIIDSTKKWYEPNAELFGVSNFFKLTSEEEINFSDGMKLLQDITLYSENKVFKFNNYFLWF